MVMTKVLKVDVRTGKEEYSDVDMTFPASHDEVITTFKDQLINALKEPEVQAAIKDIKVV